MRVEIRTLEFWRSVISECFASFIYVFVVCGAAAGAGVGAPIHFVLLATSLASGFVITSLTQCFGHISGAHVNPSVSIAMGVIKRISLLRSILFIVAQCGGGIAGAALLYRVSASGYQGNLSAIISYAGNTGPWERLGIEFVMTFIVVFSYLVSMDTYRKWIGTSSIAIGSTYSACSFVSMPFLNPARSLGPSFILNKWDNHWVYWLGPLLGGIASGLTYEYIFNPKHQRTNKDLQNDESSSIHSDEIDNYDDIDKPTPPKFHGSTYNNYRPNVTGATQNCCGSLYSVPPAKLERGESIYGGTKSLYCNSPPLTRANLNRSQSVYAKSNTGISKDIIPKPGPLVPTQSMYPLRLHQHSIVQNQNLQNQLQQRSESVYGVRGVTPGTSTNRSENHSTIDRQRDTYSITESQRSTYSTTDRKRRDNYATSESTYGTASNANSEIASKFEENSKPTRSNRPESMYGMVGSQTRRVTPQSDDSSYSSYTANSNSRNTTSSTGTSVYHNTQNTGNYPPKSSSNYTGPPGLRSINSSETRSNQPSSQLLSNAANSNTYHHQHSPIPQY
ncbi:neurogenic protein big brain-like isoform X2 [Anoplophora glabripennis]|nr:neurogenic protein big brain-like isoform X2 [Anoplophora glabripennis]